jgi:hypothetical protein
MHVRSKHPTVDGQTGLGSSTRQGLTGWGAPGKLRGQRVCSAER